MSPLRCRWPLPWAALAIALSVVSLDSWAQSSDPLTVAVIEFQRGSQVLDREILTREGFEQLLLASAPARLFGFSRQEILSGTPMSDLGDEDGPALERELGTGEAEESTRQSFFENSRVGLLEEFSRDVANSIQENEEITPEEVDRDMQPGEDPSLWSIRVYGTEEGQRLDVERLRQLRRFESEVLDEWIDRSLIVMEARRQGFEVTEAERAEALYPLLLARRNQLSGGRSEGETVIATRDIQRIEDTITLIERNPRATGDPAVRQTIRGEVEEIVREQGHDPRLFFAQLEENLLIDRLIRAKVYEYYSEEDLRQYHALFTDQFVIPPRFQYLSAKCLFHPEDTSGVREDARDSFRRLARRLRRVDEDEPLDEVIAEWEEILIDADDLPARTFMSLSDFQTQFEIPEPVALALWDLQMGETSDVVEASVGGFGSGLFIVRLVDHIPASGRSFEEARSRVEEEFFQEVRGQLVQTLRESHQGHMGFRIIRNRRGRPLSEMLAGLREEGQRPGSQ